MGWFFELWMGLVDRPVDDFDRIEWSGEINSSVNTTRSEIEIDPIEPPSVFTPGLRTEWKKSLTKKGDKIYQLEVELRKNRPGLTSNFWTLFRHSIFGNSTQQGVHSNSTLSPGRVEINSTLTTRVKSTQDRSTAQLLKSPELISTRLDLHDFIMIQSCAHVNTFWSISTGRIKWVDFDPAK